MADYVVVLTYENVLRQVYGPFKRVDRARAWADKLHAANAAPGWTTNISILRKPGKLDTQGGSNG